MRLRDRVAMALLSKESMVRAKITSSWEAGRPIYPDFRFEPLAKEGYRRNELIFACLNKTAAASASIALSVQDKQGTVLPEHPIKQLIQRPNPFMNEYDLWASIKLTQKLAGVAYFEMEKTRGGDVVALWPLRPDWVKVVPRNRIEISHYEYTVPGNPPAEIDPDVVLAFPLWDPLGLFSLWAPVATAMRVGAVDNAATDYLKLFFQNGAMPPGVIVTKTRMDDERVTEIQARWQQRYGGYNSWLVPAVLDVEADYKKIGSSFAEMGIDVLDTRNESRICAVLDIPPIIVGANVGLQRSTFSNYGEARESWWQDSLIPSFENLLDTLQNQLPAQMREGVTLAWDYSKVPAMKEMDLRRSAQLLEAAKAGLVTRNEYRQALGLGQRDDSDVFVVAKPNTTQPAEEKSQPILVHRPHQHALTEGREGKADQPASDPPGRYTRALLMERMHSVVLDSLQRQLPKAVDAVAEEIADRAGA